jgi:hypothetical protein
MWYLICYSSYAKKPAVGKGVYDTHDEYFPVGQAFSPAPALDEFSLLLSTNQAPSGSSVTYGSKSSISASYSDLDSFFDI